MAIVRPYAHTDEGDKVTPTQVAKDLITKTKGGE